MKVNKHALAAAIATVVGTVGMVNAALAAGVVADGTYNLVINTTPVFTDTVYATTSYKFGAAGTWKSSFTFGGVAPNPASQAMTDNGTTVASLGGPKGSGIAADTWAGILGITVSGSSFTVNGVSGMSGTVNTATGALTLNVTSRLGAVSSFPSLYDEAWNIDNCTLSSTGCANNGNTVYQSFSTVSATTTGSGGPVTITGNAAVANGDQNADGITDYKATMVSGGQVGSAWGGFFGAGYLEVWNLQLRSTNLAGLHSGFNVDTIFGTAGGDFAQYTASAVIPVPAAVWLFGSGLLGLVGIARRKKKA